jgi:hypothetical protein
MKKKEKTERINETKFLLHLSALAPASAWNASRQGGESSIRRVFVGASFRRALK